MRIACVGGGPGGLFFSILAAQQSGVEAVTVHERSPEGITYGWGVVFWDDLLDQLEQHDAPTARAVREAAFTWHDQIIDVNGRSPVNLGGHGYAMSRRVLRGLLTERAREVGVDLRFASPVEGLSDLGEPDLVVAADGVNSGLRRADPAFGTTVRHGRNKYIWLGTTKVFGSFTFPFVRTEAGWLWAHAYGFDAAGSTFVVETTPETWARLRFDSLDPAATMRVLEQAFAAQLDGHPLEPTTGNREVTPWLEFQTVRNERWHHDGVALLGDAAHTTHFTIGSGTRLALQDAMALGAQLGRHGAVAPALAAYAQQRTDELAPVAAEADGSAHWFEDVERYIDHDSREFAQLLINRRQLLPRRFPETYLRLHRTRRVIGSTALAQPAKGLVRRVRARS